MGNKKIVKNVFSHAESGQDVFLFSLYGRNGFQADVINYGAILVNLIVPDKEGNLTDVVTGYESVEEYQKGSCFFGATVGPNANRIAGASFEIDGEVYHLDKNDGENNLHSHKTLGYHQRVWDYTINNEENSVVFSLKDEDGSMGFPGNKEISVTYSVTQDNELKIQYHGSSDKKTIMNMTNHSYFNLAGHDNPAMNDHVLQLHASYYTEVVQGAIPTGKLPSVEGTPFDFRNPKRIGADIDAECEQLKLVGGYDHNWVTDNYNGSVREIARLTDPVSGRCMITYTDLPGVQLYTSNSLGEHTGKGNTKYGYRCAVCLETQSHPDSIHQEHFPDVVYGPEREYTTTTIYQFV